MALWKKILVFCIICICILAIYYYAYKTLPFGLMDIISKKQVPHIYKPQYGSQWNGNAPLVYKCPTATGFNKVNSGVTNEHPDGIWCVIDNRDNAEKYCNSDMSCVGFVGDGANAKSFSLTTNAVKDDRYPNGIFYKKT